MRHIIIMSLVFLPLFMAGQQSVIIDHTCINLEEIPYEFLKSAKENLHIGYGHTSHGSQLTQGMNAVDKYFTDGTYSWSNTGGAGELHLFEGGSSSGYLEGDCGTVGWANETREYLDNHSGCNVIIWSWCGQVNEVNLSSHYLGPMQQLESEYPNVKFVYMTGHLEGLGTNGSLNLANQQIREFCITNNKILYDFADIERYDPDGEVNYQNYYANDECNYNLPGGGTANWANNWLAANPGHELTQISQNCGYCSHSVSLNCVKKGIAAWYLWARLAGWEGPAAISEKKSPVINIKIYPNPASQEITMSFPEAELCKSIEILDLEGRPIYSKLINEIHKELRITNIDIPTGVYIVSIVGERQVYTGKLIYNK